MSPRPNVSFAQPRWYSQIRLASARRCWQTIISALAPGHNKQCTGAGLACPDSLTLYSANDLHTQVMCVCSTNVVVLLKSDFLRGL